jgi:cell division septation protein DedD
VGAFRDTELASRLVERLRQYRVTVATRGRPSGALARVLVGPFTDRTAAGAALRELVAAGHRAFVAFE